jgi:hypothetical protein
MLATVLLFADKASSIGSGAVLTLALPLGLTLVALAVWYFVLRRRGLLRAPRSPEQVESSAVPPGAAAPPGAPAASGPE